VSVRAKWFDDVLPDQGGDPFAQAQVETVGRPIYLDGDNARLNERLVELVTAESDMFNHGITCAIKDRDDTACSACPVARHDDSPLASLCSVGKEQERVCTALAALRGVRANSGTDSSG
jgi:hypothetical protein